MNKVTNLLDKYRLPIYMSVKLLEFDRYDTTCFGFNQVQLIFATP